MSRTETVPIRERSIVLIGFMGAGKTTVGKLVAERLSWDFIDADAEIEKRTGMKITDIFQKKGEAEFRRIERETVIELCRSSRRKVIALGGGAFSQEEIRQVCLSLCTVLFLDVSWRSFKERINALIDSRPMLQKKTMAEIEQLFQLRQSAYAFHHSKVPTDDLNPEQVADYIVDTLKIGTDLYERHSSK